MDKFKNIIPQLVVIFVSFFLYFYIRFYYQESVFFDFDMPRVALIVQDFIKNGSYMTSQEYVQESVWRNIPWGPSLVFFYSFFLNFSGDPLTVANYLTVFNFLGIVLMIYMGWKFFSPTVGALSGLLLATNPYWVSYSRIIYQPAPLPTFLIISMFLTFLAIKERNKIAAFLIPTTWVILFQIYIPTYAFILVSLIFLLINYIKTDSKKVTLKYFIFGIIFSFILLLPSINFYINNPIYIERFFSAPTLFTPPEKTFLERLEKVIVSFINIPVGGQFKWQTGYAYNDLLNFFLQIKFFSNLVSLIFSGSIIYLIIEIIRNKNNNFKQLTFWWSVVVFISLMILWVTDLVPRYFLIAIPPAMLLIAVVVNDLMIDFKDSKIIRSLLFLIPVLISIYWTAFNIKYDLFVKNYSYPHGKMYDIAETPYIHFKKAIDFVDNDAKKKMCINYYVSNDVSDLNNRWMETDYVLKYVLKSGEVDINKDDITAECLYYVVHNNLEIQEKYSNLNNRRFGPFFVLNYLDLK